MDAGPLLLDHSLPRARAPMLPNRYLLGIDWAPWAGKPGIYAVRHYRAGWRYLCSYRDGQRWKGSIFEALRRHGQAERPGDWELHHVVEGQHYADIDFSGRLAVAYREELPCVLIHKQEHIAYNQLLHINETDEMFRDALPAETAERSRAAAAEARNRTNHPRLPERLRNLDALYQHASARDSVLQRVARNAIQHHLARLRERVGGKVIQDAGARRGGPRRRSPPLAARLGR